MNWAEWRDKAIAALGDALGTYTDANGAITPALSIDPPHVTGRTVQGLEVVVTRQESLNYVPAFSSFHLEMTHRVTLKQWDAGKTTIDGLLRILPILHPNVTVGIRVPANATLGNIETQTLTFTEVA